MLTLAANVVAVNVSLPPPASILYSVYSLITCSVTVSTGVLYTLRVHTVVSSSVLYITFTSSPYFSRFMTASLQLYARATQIAIDTLAFSTDTTKIPDGPEVNDKPEHGVYIHGLSFQAPHPTAMVWLRGRREEARFRHVHWQAQCFMHSEPLCHALFANWRQNTVWDTLGPRL